MAESERMMCGAGEYAYWLGVAFFVVLDVGMGIRWRRLDSRERWLQIALKNAATQELKANELLRTARENRDEWKVAKMISDAMKEEEQK